jgi:hypothetical protein
MTDNIEPELVGIFNNGVRGAGGGGSSTPGITISGAIPAATTTTAGVVQTRNSSSADITSDTVDVVPTMWYVQNAIAQLTGGTYTIPDGGTQTVEVASAGDSQSAKAGIIKPSSDYFTVADGGFTTLKTATTQKAGVVTTCNESSVQVTSETVAVVPTQYFLQSEVARLEQAISSASGGTPVESSAWTSLTDLGSSASVTFEAGGTYLLDTTEGLHTMTAITSGGEVVGTPATVQLLVTDPTNVVGAGKLVLVDAPTENANNVYTVVFIGDTAYMKKDFAVEGYTVVSTEGTDGTGLKGSLPYALTSSPAPIVRFANSLNGSRCIASGVSALESKTLIGNGIDYTSVGGSLGGSCTMSSLMFTDGEFTGGKLCMSNAAVANVLNRNGVVTFAAGYNCISGAYVDSGMTTIEDGTHVSGSGTVNLTDRGHLVVPAGGSCYFGGTAIEHGSAVAGGAVIVSSGGYLYAEGCTFQSNFANSGTAVCVAYTANADFVSCAIDSNSGGKGTVIMYGDAAVHFSGCSVTNNYCSQGGGFIATEGPSNRVYLKDCYINSGTIMLNSGAILTLEGSNTFATGGNTKMCSAAFCHISSGAILDCTGNAGNAGDIISCGSGVIIGYDDNGTWVQGGTATVITSAGDTVVIEGSGTKITKAGVFS